MSSVSSQPLFKSSGTQTESKNMSRLPKMRWIIPSITLCFLLWIWSTITTSWLISSLENTTNFSQLSMKLWLSLWSNMKKMSFRLKARERKKARKIINAVLMTPTQIFRISVLEDSSVIFLADLSNWEEQLQGLHRWGLNLKLESLNAVLVAS